ncbi:MAG: restriction endonuclease subunit S [Calditrichaceae bacterium]
MADWQVTEVSEFLKERVGKYKPSDPIVSKLKRLDKIDFSGGMHFSDKSSKTDMIIAKKGDLVISGINVAKGALAVYGGDVDITATIHYSSYQFDDKKINVEYFKRFLKSPKFIQLLKDQVKGGIKTEIKPKHLLPLKIDLPDIDTQKSIVEFFKRTENEIGDIDFHISQQSDNLKQLRQAILQEAVEGKLTATWREQQWNKLAAETGKNLSELRELCENDPNYSAKALLEKIKAEKDRLAKDTKGTKKIKELPPISEAEKPFTLPEGWVWCRLTGLINKFSTGPFGTMLHKSDYVQDGIPLVNPMNIVANQIVANKKMMVSQTTKNRLSRYILDMNDVVLARRGDLSKCAVVSENEKGWLCGTGSFFIKVSNFINKGFFIQGFISDYFQKELLCNSIGQTMNNLNQSVLRNAVFALPPLAEQQAIVEKVDRLMAKIDVLEKQVKSRKAQVGQLMQAVLREAFNGVS